VPAEDPEAAVPRIVELVKTRIPKRLGLNAIGDIQVLCPMNRGGVGARSLNIELQAGHRHVATRRARADYKWYGFSCGCDDLAPRAYRRGAEHAV
jgi:ATP-dependent exoDNAse (exonuclease V) alpha subunit